MTASSERSARRSTSLESPAPTRERGTPKPKRESARNGTAATRLGEPAADEGSTYRWRDVASGGAAVFVNWVCRLLFLSFKWPKTELGAFIGLGLSALAGFLIFQFADGGFEGSVWRSCRVSSPPCEQSRSGSASLEDVRRPKPPVCGPTERCFNEPCRSRGSPTGH